MLKHLYTLLFETNNVPEEINSTVFKQKIELGDCENVS